MIHGPDRADELTLAVARRHAVNAATRGRLHARDHLRAVARQDDRPALPRSVEGFAQKWSFHSETRDSRQ